MFTKEKLSYWAKRLKVPADEDARYKTDIWCNRDLIPIPKERRTWGIWGYCGYWTVSGSCVSAWTIGSTMLSYGLNAQQAMACIAVGGVITGLLAIGCGWMGEVHHIGFTVSSRFSYGMRGAYIPVIIRYLPTSQLAKNDFIGFIIALILFGFLMQKPFIASFTTFVGTMFGMLIWAVHANGGSAGPLFKSAATTDNVGWAIMYGITAMIGSWGAGCLGQSDWTRYANRRGAPTLSQLIFAPIFITITALIGVVVTSCTVEILGLETIIWNPIDLLPVIQQFYGNSSGARAAVFFASIGLVLSQLAITVVLNSVSCGMDMAGLAPRWLNIRRGGYLMIIVGVLVQPWTLVATAQRFLTVLSGFRVFMAPMTGVMLADYFVVRQRKLKLNDLYRGDSTSIYWYNRGFNWRGFSAFGLGSVFLFPGFIAAGGGYSIPIAWLRLFNLTFILGTVFSFIAFLIINYFFPPPGLGEESPFYLDGADDYATKGDWKAEIGAKDEESASEEKAAETEISEFPVL
ncbi:hypothetical protein DACRYDRAFT_90066 [Dacryopinax primogenitus]|uniref:Uncharacterized protein n=1 Tax=Dacryopinax primogenitus (strain DJM 731) TaxID=1858805 RepID=M5FWC0_DACPD|nr:uncharacterized protein DACRYDRAFT_90066 [Dacryopinax primogenitus]EJT99989.1 hypothetical protein DACRYDRAFT_90066 [Dacryopinax primogenitus]